MALFIWNWQNISDYFVVYVEDAVYNDWNYSNRLL